MKAARVAFIVKQATKYWTFRFWVRSEAVEHNELVAQSLIRDFINRRGVRCDTKHHTPSDVAREVLDSFTEKTIAAFEITNGGGNGIVIYTEI